MAILTILRPDDVISINSQRIPKNVFEEYDEDYFVNFPQQNLRLQYQGFVSTWRIIIKKHLTVLKSEEQSGL